jgi:hypothetical protein
MRRLTLAAISAAALVGLGACGGGGGGSSAPPATVQGRVVLVGSAAPVNGATVTIAGRSYVTGSSTAGPGNFILANVSSDSTQITITGAGLKPLTQTLGTLTPNVINDLGDIFVLDTTDATADYKADVKGRIVRNDTFAPIAGAVVKLSGHVVTTGPDGTFAFTGLPTGLGTANTAVGSVTATGFTKRDITLGGLVLGASPPVNDLGDIVMAPTVGPTPPPPTNIQGKVTLQGVVDLSGTTVTLADKSSGATLATQTTGSDGTYGFYVVAGTYTVKAQHTGFTTQQADVTLPRPDKVQTKNFALIP